MNSRKKNHSEWDQDYSGMGLPNHERIYCERKTSLLKLNEYYEITHMKLLWIN